MSNTRSARLARCFAHAGEQSPVRKLLVPFITAGDPEPGETVALMHTLVKAGADIIELGIPFSDPMADGPVIQAASERALAHGVTLRHVFDMVKDFRKDDDDTPVVLMGYMNPIETLGYATTADLAAQAGVDGLLTVDLPPEEAGGLLAELQRADIDAVFLLSPTTPASRVKSVCEVATGYIYYVSLKGVTGAANLDLDQVRQRVGEIKSVTDAPVAVGFGIRDAESAAAIASTADAIVVGSALVALVAEHGASPDTLHRSLHELLNAMRVAMDA